MSEDQAARVLDAISHAERDAADAAFRSATWAIAESPDGEEPDPVEILAGLKTIILLGQEYGASMAAEHVVRQDPAATQRRCDADRRSVAGLREVLRLDAEGYYETSALPDFARQMLVNFAEAYGVP